MEDKLYRNYPGFFGAVVIERWPLSRDNRQCRFDCIFKVMTNNNIWNPKMRFHSTVDSNDNALFWSLARYSPSSACTQESVSKMFSQKAV